MAKDEPNRLLSKVAKFVRNPLKDWSELDAGESTIGENGYSREMLKEMIERRQRNDVVRKREFDMLRKLRQREAAGGGDVGTPSSFNVSSTSGKTEGRALTLKKIDEIEEQMSQQWWNNRAAQTPGTGGNPLRPTGMAAQHARAYADTVPGVTPPAREDGAAAQAAQAPLDGSIEEAAIRFAHRDDAGAEAILLQALAPESPTCDEDDIWLSLFDLYRAIDEPEKFTAAGLRYAQRTHRNAPRWLSLQDVAQASQAGRPAAPAAPASASGADWVSPARLGREQLVELTKALAAAGAVWRLDWNALESIDPDAAGPLRALFVHWSDSPVQLRFAGADRLLLVLAEATPVNNRKVDAVWWQLHMAALRMMHRDDEFELQALNYCITYEVSPPPWEAPKGTYAELDALPTTVAETRPGQLLAMGAEAAAELPPVRLAGELEGESLSTWQRLDSDLGKTPGAPISCAGLIRLDFAAAGTLLNWAMARDGRGQRMQFVDAHRLIAAFFMVIGITNHADVIPRQN